MGHGKLKKFAENETFRCLLQPDANAVLAKEPGSKELKLNAHPIQGRWGTEMFGNNHPIVLELGCGKGDYTIALALRHPEINYIGVDIKGARLWKGAKYATEQALPNVAFLRTRIEFIDAFFGPGEVSEIWLTFSDPQLRGSENARLSSPLFLERYRKFLKPGGIVHLKTDSRYLYEYTRSVCQVNDLQVLAYGTDIYGEGIQGDICPQNPSGSSSPCPSHSPSDCGPLPFTEPRAAMGFGGTCLPDKDAIFEVQTFYEKMFLEMGLPITYMAFRIDHEGPYAFPGEVFDHDYWLEAEGPRRSFSHQPAKKA
ncbi:MAG: tRNA (guanosine(46)-N7)-methyltransferase TrmB [Bacteroidales bacterium]|nr:tRNA (guanosine(46)-N7)-methyltransferase TrmB [Bacteroidales bacterium]